MKYYLDTEFIEGFHKPLFGKRRHFIDLISIGIVCEDGREYHAISRDYNYKDADKWVKENVIEPLYLNTVHGDMRNQLHISNFNKLKGKPNSVIAFELKHFLKPWMLTPTMYHEKNRDIELYAYFADYDWVAFCSLFGRMIDLPPGLPMYCRDLKQMMDDRGLSEDWKQSACPDPVGQHDALVDAKWNMKLHNCILKESPEITYL